MGIVFIDIPFTITIPWGYLAPGVVLYLKPLTNIVIMSSIHLTSHCPLGQHICAFIHILGT